MLRHLHYFSPLLSAYAPAPVPTRLVSAKDRYLSGRNYAKQIAFVRQFGNDSAVIETRIGVD
jgi:hypothetical protein